MILTANCIAKLPKLYSYYREQRFNIDLSLCRPKELRRILSWRLWRQDKDQVCSHTHTHTKLLLTCPFTSETVFDALWLVFPVLVCKADICCIIHNIT